MTFRVFHYFPGPVGTMVCILCIDLTLVLKVLTNANVLQSPYLHLNIK